MPPLLSWFAGREAVARVVALRLFTEPGGLRLVAVVANGQPAFAVYQRESGGAYHAHAVLVPTITRTGIARIVSFVDPGLFGWFGLPETYRSPVRHWSPAALPRATQCRAGTRATPWLDKARAGNPVSCGPAAIHGDPAGLYQ
jgi:hypothetical protein